MTEEKIEQSALELLASLGWQVLYGLDIGPDGAGEREFRDTVLTERLRRSLAKTNPHIPTPK